ncbi:MAG: hypothetical protein AAFU67_18835, partial [Bacteroidota bacterium]
FYLLPKHLHAEVIGYYNQDQLAPLIKIYNEYRVSPDYLLSCCSYEKVMEHTRQAIQKGILYGGSEEV